jgi:hypothetical protein
LIRIRPRRRGEACPFRKISPMARASPATR